MVITIEAAVFAAFVAALGGLGVAALNRYRNRRQQAADAVPGLVSLNTALGGSLDREAARANEAEDREDRMRAERDAAFAARAVAESTARIAIAHMHVLETHINEGKPPPPPPRPEGLFHDR